MAIFDVIADYSQSVDDTDAPWDRDDTQVARSNDDIRNPDDRRRSVYNNVTDTDVTPAVNTNPSVSNEVEKSRLTGVINLPVIAARELNFLAI